MSFVNLHGRRSGRSTRLVEAALMELQQNRDAYILCVDQTGVSYMKALFEKVCLAQKIYMSKYPRFLTLNSQVADISGKEVTWKDQILRNTNISNEIFIDHHVFEHLFGHIINGYHKYDTQIMVNSIWANERLKQ